MYLHSEGQEALMIMHCWDDAPTSLRMRPHSETDVMVKPIVQRRSSAHCSADKDQSRYYQCSRETIGKQLMDPDFGNSICPENAHQRCAIPQVKKWPVAVLQVRF